MASKTPRPRPRAAGEAAARRPVVVRRRSAGSRGRRRCRCRSRRPSPPAGAASSAGNRAPLLDREVGDAAGGVEHVGLDQRAASGRPRDSGCSCRSGRSSAARSARQRQVGEDRADEEERAGPGPDEHGVLADPAEASAVGQRAFGDRAVVHVGVRHARRRASSRNAAEPVEPAAASPGDSPRPARTWRPAAAPRSPAVSGA